MPIVTLSINRSPMALPTLRGPDSAQGQVQRKSKERAVSFSVFMWENSEWPRGKNQQLFSFVPHWSGCRSLCPNGGSGRRDPAQSLKESPAPPCPTRRTQPLQPFLLPRLTEGLKSFHPLEVSFFSKSDLSLFPPEDLFPESRSLEQMRLLTLKVDHPSLRATVSSSDNQTPFLVLPSYLRC